MEDGDDDMGLGGKSKSSTSRNGNGQPNVKKQKIAQPKDDLLGQLMKNDRKQA